MFRGVGEARASEHFSNDVKRSHDLLLGINHGLYLEI